MAGHEIHFRVTDGNCLPYHTHCMTVPSYISSIYISPFNVYVEDGATDKDGRRWPRSIRSKSNCRKLT